MATVTVDTTLYYTFSTIAQSLAAALGLLAAVVLFSLERIAAKIDQSARDLLGPNMPSGDDERHRHQLHLRGQHRELHANFEAWFASLSDRGGAKAQTLVTYRLHLERDAAIRAAFRSAAAATAIVATLAVVALVATPWLAQRGRAAPVALGLGVVGFVICAGFYWSLVASLLPGERAPSEEKRKPPEPPAS